MKQKHILFYGLLALLGAGCSDQKEEFASYGEVQVTAGISAGSRVSFNEVANITYANWQDGDAITLSTASQGNLDYVASVSGTTITFSPEGTSLKDISGETVQACYPAGSISGGKVSLPTTDTWSDDEPMPFAYAVSSIQNSKVNLQFKHIFSFLKLTVTSDMLADSTRTVAAVTVSTSSSEPLSAGAGDTFDFSTLTASTTNGGNSVRITTDTQVTHAGWTVYIPVLPQPAGADITLTLTDSEGATLYTLTKATPDTGFLAGNVYRVGTTVSFDTSYLIDGPTFNASIKELASDVVAGRGVNDADSLIAKVEFLTEVPTLPDKYITVSAADSPAPIYASFNATDSLLTVFTPAKDIEVVDASYMFYRLKSLQTIDFGNFDINETTTNIRSMFNECISLTNLDVTDWNTSNVTDISYTFWGCSKLTSINVSRWNTKNVTTMTAIFCGCSALTSIDISAWDTANVTSMWAMFSFCTSLTSIDIAAWNTENVTDMRAMFNECPALSMIDVSNWNVSNVTDMWHMFNGCSSLTTLDVSNWNTEKVTDMGAMFNDCSSLAALDVSNWNMSNVTSIGSMFANCSSLTSLDVSNWDTKNMIGMGYAFNYCSSLTSLDVSNWNTANVTSMQEMFYNCASLTNLDVSNWNTENVTNMFYLFGGCSSLTILDVSNWDTSSATDISWMFYGCQSLSTLDVSNWNTANVTNMSGIFTACSLLTTLDVSNWNTKKVIDISWMFQNCSALTTLDVSIWDTSNVTDMSATFIGCSALVTLDISNWNFNDNINITYMFYGCASTSQACEITATQETQDFLLSNTETTLMNPAWFIWTNGKTEGGSSVENMPNQGW